MLLRRFYDPALAQASYLIGCQATGDAIVIDPNRDLAPILAAAAEEGVRITQVTETHIHADYVSGARDLARRTGARLLLSGEGGPDWQYAFAAADGATLLHDGDVIAVGNLRLEVWHVPGHTPEHLAFVVTDLPAASGPMGLVSGDLLFVGDVGRPDLLETAAGVQGTMEPAARALFHSLARVRALPDHLQLWPGHGAGSACGKALGAVPTSTLGYEKLANWGLRETDEARFVAAVLDGQPEPPAYFAHMKRINREGPPPLDRLPTAPRLGDDALAAMLARPDTVVLDVRPGAQSATTTVTGALAIPYSRSWSTWAGALVPFDASIVLLLDPATVAVDALVRDLVLIGLDRIDGWMDAAHVAAWQAAGGRVQPVPRWDAARVGAALDADLVTVVDVRGVAEWRTGHLPGAVHVPLGALPAAAATLPRDRPIVVQCLSGARSAIASSVLRRARIPEVIELEGGITAWRQAGRAVTTEEGMLAGAGA
jgi:hydroxyacylglutathione hydrolase